MKTKSIIILRRLLYIGAMVALMVRCQPSCRSDKPEARPTRLQSNYFVPVPASLFAGGERGDLRCNLNNLVRRACRHDILAEGAI